jgi:hypothetical protein
MTCAIWDTLAKELPRTGNFVDIDSPRTGGLYRLTGTVAVQLPGLELPGKMAITRWLVRQRSFGIEIPELNSRTFLEALSTKPVPLSAKIAAVILHFGKELERLDQTFDIGGDPARAAPTAKLIALADMHDGKELQSLLKTMVDMGLLNDAGSYIGVSRYRLMPAAWQKFEELSSSPAVGSAQAFVAMWFGDTMKEVYEQGFVPAVQSCGYSPFRIDKKEHANKIDDEIVAEIRRSRFLIADFTCEPGNPRGGVYFEAGFAMGLGLPVIWTCRKDIIEAGALHFDTRQYNHIDWQTPEDLRTRLAARIGFLLGDGPEQTV